jgi:hypothetical protein
LLVDFWEAEVSAGREGFGSSKRDCLDVNRF